MNGHRRTNNNRVGRSGTGPFTLMAITAVPAFFAGTMSSVLLGLTRCNCSSNTSFTMPDTATGTEIDRLVERKLTAELPLRCQVLAGRVLENHVENEEAARQASQGLLPPEAVGRFAVGMARVSKQEFTDKYDLGVPLDPPTAGQEDLLLLYSHTGALPTNFADTEDQRTIPSLGMERAVENCDYLNVVLTDHGNRHQCVAILPQYESFHIQKWMRINGMGKLDGTDGIARTQRQGSERI
jgi:hypothetical protein